MHENSAPPCRIVLVAPANSPGSIWDFSAAYRVLGKRAQSPPLGLIQIAAMLPKERYEVRLVDCNVTPLTDADLQAADLVFVTGLSTAAASLEEVLARCRRLGKTSVLGGAHALLFYSQLDADCFVLGEMEAVWESFLADLDAKALRRAYAFTLSGEEREAMSAFFGDSIFFGEGSTPPDMRFARTPRYDLLDMDAYYMMAIQTTRGCPCKCEFCDIWRRYGRKPRHRPPESVIADLDELYRLGWRGLVLLADDNIIGNRGYAVELLTQMARWQVEHRRPFYFASEGSLNLAEDMKLMELFAAVKLTTLFIGLETPCAESLSETNKYINLKGDMASRVAILQEQGINAAAGFIVGFDSDPADIAQQMHRAVSEMGLPLVMVGLLLAVPNSDLFDRMRRQGRLFEAGKAPLSNSHAFIPNFSPFRPMHEVTASYRDTLSLLYPEDMKSYFERCLTFISRRLNKRRPLKRIFADVVPGAVPLVSKEDVAKGGFAFSAKMIGRMLYGTLSQAYRWNALAFLWRVFRTRREHFHTAVGFVLLAAHLRRVTGAYLEAAGFWDVMVTAAKKLRDEHGVRLEGDGGVLGLGRECAADGATEPDAGDRPAKKTEPATTKPEAMSPEAIPPEAMPPEAIRAVRQSIAELDERLACLSEDARQAVEGYCRVVCDDLRSIIAGR